MHLTGTTVKLFIDWTKPKICPKKQPFNPQWRRLSGPLKKKKKKIVPKAQK